MASSSDIRNAFQNGNADDDDALNVPETQDALRILTGKSIGSSTIEQACASCGIDIGSREMTLDEFTEVVRHLEGNGEL